MKVIGTMVKKLLLLFIKAYRYLWSPIFPSHCRFHPTCSAYAVEAIKLHGTIKGLWLIIKRLSRCHPFAQGGLDPVPPPYKRHVKMKHLRTSDK